MDFSPFEINPMTLVKTYLCWDKTCIDLKNEKSTPFGVPFNNIACLLLEFMLHKQNMSQS